MSTLAATIGVGDAARGQWDVAVVGAGLAGSMAALGAARAGARVLVVDKAAFPRWKVCGCCLSARAVRTLEEAGLGELVERLGARRIERVGIHARRRWVEAPLAPTWVVSREALDAALLGEGISAGAALLDRVRARVLWGEGEDGRIELRAGDECVGVRARAIIVASGLHDVMPGAAGRGRVARASHVGLGATGDSAVAPGLARHLTMAVSAHGYCGFVHLEDGRLNAAAAVSPGLLREAGSSARAIARVLDESGLGGVDVDGLAWRGTPPLTRARTRAQQGNVFAVGDAARFVEPVTGEGMAWALAAGSAVVPHVMGWIGASSMGPESPPTRDVTARESRPTGDMAARESRPTGEETWSVAHRRLLRGRHARCTLVSRAMRRPVIMSAFMRTMVVMPKFQDRAIRVLVGAPRAGAGA